MRIIMSYILMNKYAQLSEIDVITIQHNKS